MGLTRSLLDYSHIAPQISRSFTGPIDGMIRVLRAGATPVKVSSAQTLAVPILLGCRTAGQLVLMPSPRSRSALSGMSCSVMT
jgi:hypothetical protein